MFLKLNDQIWMILVRKALLLRVWVFISSGTPNICPVKIARVLTVFIGSTLVAFGQEVDTLQSRELEPLVITATRTERTVGALPMPVVLVPKMQMRTMGSLRLTEVLAEQTGLAVVPQVNGQGSGIQIQGLNPDYTLILLNGEPLIGRYTGSLELSRIAVGNIKQIEIVKGPSSSLYGSDALAGVVNIITERAGGTRGSVYSRYGTNNTLDLSGDYGTTFGKLGVYVFGNRYSTNGYDLSPENYGKTVSPFTNYTGSVQLKYAFSPATELNISGRAFSERQHFDFEVLTAANEKIRTRGAGTSSDWNLNPVLTHRLNDRSKLTARFYATHYQTQTELVNPSTDTLYYADSFQQNFMRPELNFEYFFNEKNIVTLGGGANFESVQTQRYGDAVDRTQRTTYGFIQDEWTPFKKFQIIAGARLDQNTVYGSQLSPKLSMRYELGKRVVLKGSYGVGFKAPDFRQLYLNFNNTAAGGYSVLGTEVVTHRLAEMDAQGLIQGYLFDPATLGNLDAERSQAINLGARAELPGHLVADVNLFYNSIDNLIETQAVAITTSNQTIYSYRNIKRVYTEGAEVNLSYPVAKNLNLSLGYQLLFAKDADVAGMVERGEVYWRDPETLITKRLQSSEYFGLYNRSRHMGNLKLFYADQASGWEASARVLFRGKYGVGDIRGNIQGEVLPPADINGNGILDSYDNFVEGYALVNFSIAKSIPSGFRFQLGVDNVFDYKNPIYIPNIPGRLAYASVGFTFFRKQSKSNQ
jgi:outer membrane receptor for ferrienterochelin and colicins